MRGYCRNSPHPIRSLLRRPVRRWHRRGTEPKSDSIRRKQFLHGIAHFFHNRQHSNQFLRQEFRDEFVREIVKFSSKAIQFFESPVTNKFCIRTIALKFRHRRTLAATILVQHHRQRSNPAGTD